MIVLPIIRNLGDLKKSGWNNPPKLAKTTQAKITEAETTQGRNDSGPKWLWAETTRNVQNHKLDWAET